MKIVSNFVPNVLELIVLGFSVHRMKTFKLDKNKAPEEMSAKSNSTNSNRKPGIGFMIQVISRTPLTNNIPNTLFS